MSDLIDGIIKSFAPDLPPAEPTRTGEEMDIQNEINKRCEPMMQRELTRTELLVENERLKKELEALYLKAEALDAAALRFMQAVGVAEESFKDYGSLNATELRELVAAERDLIEARKGIDL